MEPSGGLNGMVNVLPSGHFVKGSAFGGRGVSRSSLGGKRLGPGDSLSGDVDPVRLRGAVACVVEVGG